MAALSAISINRQEAGGNRLWEWVAPEIDDPTERGQCADGRGAAQGAWPMVVKSGETCSPQSKNQRRTSPRIYDISASFFLTYVQAFFIIFKIKWPKFEEKLILGLHRLGCPKQMNPSPQTKLGGDAPGLAVPLSHAVPTSQALEALESLQGFLWAAL